MREKFVSKLGFEPQISGFTHRRLNNYNIKTHVPTQKQTSLPFINQFKTLVNVILYYNSILRATQQVVILFGFTLYINW